MELITKPVPGISPACGAALPRDLRDIAHNVFACRLPLCALNSLPWHSAHAAEPTNLGGAAGAARGIKAGVAVAWMDLFEDRQQPVARIRALVGSRSRIKRKRKELSVTLTAPETAYRSDSSGAQNYGPYDFCDPWDAAGPIGLLPPPGGGAYPGR